MLVVVEAVGMQLEREIGNGGWSWASGILQVITAEFLIFSYRYH